MRGIDRRSFFQSSFCGLSAAYLAQHGLFASAQDATGKPSADTNLEHDTLFLTWHRDPTTTMTIQWLSAELPSMPKIEFGTLPSTNLESAACIAKPYTNTDLKVYRCELTGLKPGTEYKFQISGSQAAYRFRTMPSKINDEFRFITGGDAGIDAHAVATNRLAALQNPNFVLIAGDLAYDNGTSPDTFTKFLQNYHATMFDSEHRLIPMITCIGNHEVKGGYSVQRADSPQYLALFDGMFAEKTYSTLDFGDYMSLVLLDSGHIAPIAGEQSVWLEKQLADRRESPHLFVANHVPAYPSYRPPEGVNGKFGTGEEQRLHWCPLFEKYKVDVVLEHHDHTFKRTHPLTGGMKDANGVVYLGDGSWGKLRVPKTPEERPYLAKVAQAYHMTVHSLEGDRRFHIAMEESGRIADVYSTYSKRPSRRG